eukprot:1161518-Pelagomonas_calceolata.AAC.12
MIARRGGQNLGSKVEIDKRICKGGGRWLGLGLGRGWRWKRKESRKDERKRYRGKGAKNTREDR